MQEEFNIAEIAVGLGLFLFGMSLFEDALKNLSGRRFKRFLRENTKSTIKAIGSGAFVTAVLQSSSLVSLMTLALVGAGVIPFRNAVALVWGANLGTTATGWIFSLLGFKLKLKTFSSACILIGSLGALIFKDRKKVKNYSLLLFGFGALFLGLDFMKGSIKNMALSYDLSSLADLHFLWFYPFGIIITALIQSSSATMVITLSALSAGILNMHQAMAIVVGGDLGTTITIFIGAFGGDGSKKRVAWGHFLFNFFNNVVFLLGLNFLAPWFSKLQPLYAIVGFHSVMNLTGIILLGPFLKPFTVLLLKINPKKKKQVARFIHQVSPEVPDLSVDALKNEGISLMYSLVGLSYQAFKDKKPKGEVYNKLTFHTFDFNRPLLKNFEDMKRWEGECLRYYLDCLDSLENYQGFSLYDTKFEGIKKVLSSTKHIKDVHQNLERYHNSGRNEVYDFFLSLRDRQYAFLNEVLKSMESEGSNPNEIKELQELNHHLHDELVEKAYTLYKEQTLRTVESSTALLTLREIYSCNKGITLALADIYA